MAIQEVRYYIIECDDCGKKHEHEDDDLNLLLAAVTEDDWTVDQSGQFPSVLCAACSARGLGRGMPVGMAYRDARY